jgi:hypothetical protein
MKELIRKILHEAIQIGPDTPDWVEKFHDLSREERIEFIKDYKKRVERLIPMIVDFFKSKYGDSLKKIEVGEKRAHFGNEQFSIEKPLLKFYFDFSGMNRDSNWGILNKREIFRDLRFYFNIDMSYYGTPLEYEVYQMTWERV